MADRHNMTTHLINESNHLQLENRLLRDRNEQLLQQNETPIKLAKELGEQISEYQSHAFIGRAS